MSDIYTYITEQESAFTKPIHLETDWWWNFKEHVRRSYLYKNSQFEQNNEDRRMRPNKNIIRPILNIEYRTEGFDVKDIEIYVDNSETYYKSFLIKKFHHKWALKNEMDTFIDEVVESFVDYGGVLVKNVGNIRPEVVDLRTIAFCDQTDILSGPFAIKHFFSPSQLREMEKKGWGDTSNGATITISDLILKGENKKTQDRDVVGSATPGLYTEIYEVRNVSDIDIDPNSEETELQMEIVALYTDEDGNSQGVTLFKKPEPKDSFKLLKRDPVQGRALGFGGVEELFEAQVWTNFGEISIMGMLEQASKSFYVTTDSKFKGQNLVNSDNGKVFDIMPNSDFAQMDTQPRNITAFNDSVERWNEHANIMGAASDLFLGQQPTAGTPFKSVETQLVEGKSLHLWRQGRIATFMDEIYRDWSIPHFVKEIVKDVEFIATLTSDELQSVTNSLVTNETNKMFKEKMLMGEIPTEEEKALFEQVVREDFMKTGEQKFLKILKDEMKGEKLNVYTNIVGKQKDLSLVTDKLVNILRQFIATPEIRQDPGMNKLLNEILESSGLSPVMFAPPQLSPIQPQQGQGGGGTEPLKALAESTQGNERG